MEGAGLRDGLCQRIFGSIPAVMKESNDIKENMAILHGKCMTLDYEVDFDSTQHPIIETISLGSEIVGVAEFFVRQTVVHQTTLSKRTNDEGDRTPIFVQIAEYTMLVLAGMLLWTYIVNMGIIVGLVMFLLASPQFAIAGGLVIEGLFWLCDFIGGRIMK